MLGQSSKFFFSSSYSSFVVVFFSSHFDPVSCVFAGHWTGAKSLSKSRRSNPRTSRKVIWGGENTHTHTHARSPKRRMRLAEDSPPPSACAVLARSPGAPQADRGWSSCASRCDVPAGCSAVLFFLSTRRAYEALPWKYCFRIANAALGGGFAVGVAVLQPTAHGSAARGSGWTVAWTSGPPPPWNGVLRCTKYCGVYTRRKSGQSLARSRSRGRARPKLLFQSGSERGWPAATAYLPFSLYGLQ